MDRIGAVATLAVLASTLSIACGSSAPDHASIDAGAEPASDAPSETPRASEHDLLRPGLTVEEAAHVLWLLTNFDAFDVLYTGRGLSLEAVVEVLTTTAERSLYR